MTAGVTRNPLRPERLADVVGQTRAKHLLERTIDSSYARRKALPHMLFIGPSGTGKTTLALAVANECSVTAYHLAAPVAHDTLMDLRTQLVPGDIIFIDEIHLQALQERRGRMAATEPEQLYAIMEDRQIVTKTGVLPYPEITIIGATTDPGMLPEPFLGRFPLRPVFERYSEDELMTIARYNSRVLGLNAGEAALLVFVRACRYVPRNLNTLTLNAQLITRPGDPVTVDTALEVLDVNGWTEDGLTPQMQSMLRFMLSAGRPTGPDGEIRYSASVNTIATAIGLSRDNKAVALHVEPWLIEQGWVQVAAGVGRVLTDAGIERARRL